MTARSVSTLSVPWTAAKRSWPFEAKVAIARSSPRSSLTMSLSLEVKNQIGPPRRLPPGQSSAARGLPRRHLSPASSSGRISALSRTSLPVRRLGHGTSLLDRGGNGGPEAWFRHPHVPPEPDVVKADRPSLAATCFCWSPNRTHDRRQPYRRNACRRHDRDADHDPAEEGPAQRLAARHAAAEAGPAAPRRPRLHAALRAGARGSGDARIAGPRRNRPAPRSRRCPRAASPWSTRWA